ncbi:MAG: hypothetical protein ACRD9R_23955, partial [Pyrinomonadaceae bacterium]
MRHKWGLLLGVLLVGASALAGGAWVRGSVSPRVGAPQAKRADSGGWAEVERDYNEAMALVTDSYADEIDYEKASQAAIQGMLWT